MLRSLPRIIKLGYTNFWRNRWLTLGATLLMTLTLTMISVSLLMTFLLRDTASSIQAKIDLTVYFRDDTVADHQITELGDRIKPLANVTAIHFVTKAEALKIWQRLPINENIKAPVTTQNNPLPRSLEIKTNDPSKIPTIVTGIEKADTQTIICSECVSYTQNKDTVNRLISASRFVQLTGIGLSIFFGVIAIFNVLNIIRLTIIARADEIEIMRYVGASNAFIRGPFVIEGILYGVFGTVFTMIFLLITTAIAAHYVGTASGIVTFFQLLNVNLFQYLMDHFVVLLVVQLAGGMLLGIAVSLFSMRRYLRA